MPTDQERIFLLAGVIVAFTLSIFVFWGPSNIKAKRRRGVIGGLVNLGYSCFLNTLLQAFASCPHLLHWLERNENGNGLITALRQTLQVINGECRELRDDPYSPIDVLSWLKAKYHIAPGEQDAHELFIILITALEDEAGRLQKRCSLADALVDATRSDSTRSETVVSREQNGVNLPRRTQSELLVRVKKMSLAAVDNATPFQGLLSSSLQCTSCNHKNTVTCSKVDSLSLALPPASSDAVSLTQMLDQFVAVETVSATCDMCKKETPTTKTLNFAKLPGCLCIHIVRTTWTDNGQPLKRSDHVDFPQLLVMDAYTYAQREGETRRHVYCLRAVVVHSGDLDRGHFVTYRRSKHNWFLASDAFVTESSWWQVQQVSAYMLFYDKLP